MTFEELQKIIEEMLGVQRELQESQSKTQETLGQQHEIIDRMLGVQRELQESQLRVQSTQERQQRMLDRLLNYVLSSEIDVGDMEEKMAELERRVRRLEQ